MSTDSLADAAESTDAAEPLATLTTLRVGGPARRLVTASTSRELVDAVEQADAAGEDVLVLGGGSNVVIADEGFDGTVVLVRSTGIEVESGDYCGGAVVRVAAGHDWDALVAHAVASGWSGLEALSGIPGTVGASPVQNVGAYGAQVSDVVAQVVTWDRRERRQRTLSGPECAFAYRSSAFKTDPGRFVILAVVFQLRLADISAPVRYAELASRLGVELGARVPLADVRQAVLALRRGKGMVLDPADFDTWSVGSFFTNPIVASPLADSLPPAAPRYPAGEGAVKVSAAWLVQHAGFPPGAGLPGHELSPASVSTKHSLALTNRGAARTADVLELARAVRVAVAECFAIVLEPEPQLVGCAL